MMETTRGKLSRRRQRLIALLVAGILAAVGANPSAAESLAIEAVPLQISPLPVGGQDAFFGALRLRSKHPRFGGLSGICIEETGQRMLAVSDRGSWISASLEYDTTGRLTGVGEGAIGQLIGEDGKPLLYRDTDAEAIACLPDGSRIVSFERNHRLLQYPASKTPFGKAPIRLVPPPGFDQLPVNFGVEALARLGNGTLVAISELIKFEQHANLAWIGGPRSWKPFSYVPPVGFRVTDATATTTGDLLVLEHHYDPLLGNVVRVAHLPRSAIEEARRIEARQILLLGPPAINANFEGIAIRPGPAGEEFVYLISDNNLRTDQPTILLLLKLQKEALSTSPQRGLK